MERKGAIAHGDALSVVVIVAPTACRGTERDKRSFLSEGEIMKKTQNKMQNKNGQNANRNGAENCGKAQKSQNGNVENCR